VDLATGNVRTDELHVTRRSGSVSTPGRRPGNLRQCTSPVVDDGLRHSRRFENRLRVERSSGLRDAFEGRSGASSTFHRPTLIRGRRRVGFLPRRLTNAHYRSRT
jgi:hypothetical protein